MYGEIHTSTKPHSEFPSHGRQTHCNKEGSQALCCTAWWQGYFNNPPFKQKLLKTRLSEPGRNPSPAVQCSGTESQWSPFLPARPASLCHPSPRCTATRAVRAAPAYSGAVNNPGETGQRDDTSQQGLAWQDRIQAPSKELKEALLDFQKEVFSTEKKKKSCNRFWLCAFW